MEKAGFIGAGNMGAAMIRAASGRAAVCVYDTDRAKLDALEGVEVFSDVCELARVCKYVVLAVKPQNMGGLLAEIKDAVTPETVLVSIAAGITSEFIKSRVKAKVILAMPNTPFLIGEGAVALARTEGVEDAELDAVTALFSASALTRVIPEEKMNEIIPINGSSPAFIYLFAKSFIDYAVSVGIDSQTATELFCQTLIGSAKMITQSGDSIDTLITKVSSPGGTTLAGLAALRDFGFAVAVENACSACSDRAAELAAAAGS